MPVKGSYLAVAAGGAILLWSGIKGKRFTAVLRNVVSGQDPRTAAAQNRARLGFQGADKINLAGLNCGNQSE